MKRGDLVGWRSDLMYGLPDENPMVVIENLNGMIDVINPRTGWRDWVSQDELSVISSGNG